MKEGWFIRRGKNHVGPFSAEQLKSLAGRGELTPEDRVARKGMKSSVQAKTVEGLFETGPFMGTKPSKPEPPIVSAPVAAPATAPPVMTEHSNSNGSHSSACPGFSWV